MLNLQEKTFANNFMSKEIFMSSYLLANLFWVQILRQAAGLEVPVSGPPEVEGMRTSYLGRLVNPIPTRLCPPHKLVLNKKFDVPAALWPLVPLHVELRNVFPLSFVMEQAWLPRNETNANVELFF